MATIPTDVGVIGALFFTHLSHSPADIMTLHNSRCFNRNCVVAFIFIILLILLLQPHKLYYPVAVNHEEGYSQSDSYWESQLPARFYPRASRNLRGLIEAEWSGTYVPNPNYPVNSNFINITFSSRSVRLCGPQEPLALLILIKSAATNLKKRSLLRSMWANSSYLSKFNVSIKYAFVIGVGQFSNDFPIELEDEVEAHKDFVMIDYMETYRNNTYKTILSMKWALESCKFEFLLMVDDDMYLSVKNVIKFLQNSKSYPHIGHTDSSVNSKFAFSVDPKGFFYAGAMYGGAVNQPIRIGNDSKIFTSWDAYPLDKFPTYATGGAVFYTRKTLKYVQAAAKYVKHLDIDDAYVGIILAKLEVPTTDLSQWIECCRQWYQGCPTNVTVKGFNETAIAIHMAYVNVPHKVFWLEYQGIKL